MRRCLVDQSETLWVILQLCLARCILMSICTVITLSEELTCEYGDWKQHPQWRLGRSGGSFEPGRLLCRWWVQMKTGTRFPDSRSCLALRTVFLIPAFFVTAHFQAKCTKKAKINIGSENVKKMPQTSRWPCAQRVHVGLVSSHCRA